MFHTPYPEHKRLAVLLGAGVATTGALLLITRKLTARARLDISSLDELEDYETRGLVVGLLSAPPRVAIVRLAGLGTLLPTIPSSVLRMGPALQELDLSGCSLTTLPDSIARLSGLKRLSLSRNQLGELPPAIGKLAGLVDLDISNNQLPALPEEIGALSSLRYLNAMANQLDTLPASIGSLSALYRLGLKSNRLTSLPASIGGLASLVEIFLTDNLLESLPPEMGKLTALVKFQVGWGVMGCGRMGWGGLVVDGSGCPDVDLAGQGMWVGVCAFNSHGSASASVELSCPSLMPLAAPPIPLPCTSQHTLSPTPPWA